MTGDELEVDAVDDVGLPDHVTVSMKVEAAPAVVPGSKKTECIRCGEPVVLSPATLSAISRGTYPDSVACVECANEHAGDS